MQGISRRPFIQWTSYKSARLGIQGAVFRDTGLTLFILSFRQIYFMIRILFTDHEFGEERPPFFTPYVKKYFFRDTPLMDGFNLSERMTF